MSFEKEGGTSMDGLGAEERVVRGLCKCGCFVSRAGFAARSSASGVAKESSEEAGACE